MTKMWRGPSKALKAAESNPLWGLIHRRNGRLGISCNIDSQTKTAIFYRVEQGGGRCGTWFRYDLGEVRGLDPMLNVLWGSHQFTPADAELFDLHHRYIHQQLEQIEGELHLLSTKLARACDEFLP